MIAPMAELPKFDMASLESFAAKTASAELKPEFTTIHPKPNKLDTITLEDFHRPIIKP